MVGMMVRMMGQCIDEGIRVGRRLWMERRVQGVELAATASATSSRRWTVVSAVAEIGAESESVGIEEAGGAKGRHVEGVGRWGDGGISGTLVRMASEVMRSVGRKLLMLAGNSE